MKQAILYFLLIFGCITNAQNVQVVSNVLNFSNTNELSTSTEQVQVFNPGIYPITVTDIDLFSAYGILPFTLSDTAFTLMPLDTQTIDVAFAPNQNVDYYLGLIIKTNSGFGHVAVDLIGKGAFSDPYYNSTQNLSDVALKTALNVKLAAGYNSLGYNGARDQMFLQVDNQKNNGQGATVNTLECIYTGITITGYANRSAAQNGNPQFNTEHTFPQSKFNSSEPMKSDMHHLFPTTNTSNSQRGSDPFGVVSGAGSWSSGGSKSSGSTFEPRDVQKGATARAMMYFVLRYQDYQNFFASQESILRTWHASFPPTAIDEARNNAIAALQTSRNPFVDYPQFADRIFSIANNTSRPTFKQFYSSDDTIRLAKVAGRYIYNYVLYNEGTEPIQVSNFALSDTSLRFFQGAPASLTLAPGRAETLNISYNSQNVYNANLTFATDQMGNGQVSIPIVSGTSIGLDEARPMPSFAVYPNPAQEYFNLSFVNTKPVELYLVNTQGETVKIKATEKVFCGHLSKGIYVVKAVYKNGNIASKRLVII